ncbi:MAG: EAL domain-containing protein [Campylobacterota bacterium]|nr:EAL domain-containing protein [Campylobacterota bacterium]
MILRKYSNSIAVRLFINIILIHSFLIGILLYDLIQKESEFIHEQLLKKGRDSATILASSASATLLNNDLVALNELILEMDNISSNYMTFVLDSEFRVRASRPNHYFNQTLVDDRSKSLLSWIDKNSTKTFYQVVHDELVDTVAKVYADGHLIGYVRVILDQREFNQAIKKMVQEGALFAFLAILLGSVVAWFSVNRMTTHLNQLTNAAKKISQRDFDVQLPKIKTKDEIASMTQAFKVMQNSMHEYIVELNESQERLTLALEGSSDGLWDLNLISYQVYFSPRWKEMLGYSDDELNNSFETWQSSLHLDDREKTTTYLNDFLASSNTKYEIKFRMKQKDGNYLPILARAKKVFDSNGKAVRLIGTHVDISEITKAQERLKYQALHDSLTNLPNREYLKKELNELIEEAREQKSNFAMMFLDLDHFKEINDTHGHTIGDALLVSIAQILKRSVSPQDFVARLGGDEFIIILKNIPSRQNIIDTINTITQKVSQPHFIHYRTFYTTFSIGVTLYPQDGIEEDILLKNADIAMYHAKHISRNTYQFYTSELGEKVMERSRIESKLRSAIENDEFKLYYQPQVNSQSGEIVGVEVLTRWMPHKGEPISPSLFIPLAEDIGLISKLDSYIMAQALQSFAHWRVKGAKIDKISLNLSLAELNYTHYVEDVLALLHQNGIEPHALELEITESQIMKDPLSAIEKLNQLADVGIEIAIDDFGTGYSSLAYLKQLPIHKLKIDKSFIDDILSNSDSQVIVKTIISMAKSMNLDIIAEGVEQEAQKEFLMAHGCFEIQGYYYYKPMPQEELEKLIL